MNWESSNIIEIKCTYCHWTFVIQGKLALWFVVTFRHLYSIYFLQILNNIPMIFFGCYLRLLHHLSLVNNIIVDNCITHGWFLMSGPHKGPSKSHKLWSIFNNSLCFWFGFDFTQCLILLALPTSKSTFQFNGHLFGITWFKTVVLLYLLWFLYTNSQRAKITIYVIIPSLSNVSRRKDSGWIWSSSWTHWGTLCTCRTAGIANMSHSSSGDRRGRRPHQNTTDSVAQNCSPLPEPTPSISNLRLPGRPHPGPEIPDRLHGPLPSPLIAAALSCSGPIPKTY